MTLDAGRLMEAIQLWGTDHNRMSTNFFSLPKESLESIREAMWQVAMALWQRFKTLNMFDFNNIDAVETNSSFPFVLSAIVGSNLVFLKDNIISSNEVKLHGRFS